MKRFKDIFCVMESGEACKGVLTRALADNNQASLNVISMMPHIKGGIRIPKANSFLANLDAEMINSRTQELEILIEPYRKQIKIEALKTHLLQGLARKEILARTNKIEADMVSNG